MTTTEFHSHPNSFPTVRYKNSIVRQNLSSTLYKLIAVNTLENDWIKKGRYSTETSNTIQWSIQEEALKSAPLKTKRFICKWVSNTIGQQHGEMETSL